MPARASSRATRTAWSWVNPSPDRDRGIAAAARRVRRAPAWRRWVRSTRGLPADARRHGGGACRARVLVDPRLGGLVLGDPRARGRRGFAMLGLAPRARPPRCRGQRRGACGTRPPGSGLGLGCRARGAFALLSPPWLASATCAPPRASGGPRRTPPSGASTVPRRSTRSRRALPLRGPISPASGRLGAAREAYSEALERNERDWYATLELGAIASMQGDRPAATRLLSRAARLLPRDETTRAALARLHSGGRLDVRKINARLRAQTRKLVDPR